MINHLMKMPLYRWITILSPLFTLPFFILHLRVDGDVYIGLWIIDYSGLVGFSLASFIAITKEINTER